jgi:hypothetical protein
MGGMMGTAAQWVRFETGFAKLRRRYHFNVLHMLDFKKAITEFDGWDSSKMVNFLRDWDALIGAGQIMEGVTVRIGNAAYKEEYIGDRPRKPRLDTAYGLCFRNRALHLLLEAERRLGHDKRWEDTRLHFFLELGHKNAGDAQRIFNELKTDFSKIGNNTLATITFAGKKDCPPLVVGDFLSHAVRSMDQVQRSTTRPVEEFFGNGHRGKSNLTHITYKSGGLANVREQLIGRLRARQKTHGVIPSDRSASAASVSSEGQ